MSLLVEQELAKNAARIERIKNQIIEYQIQTGDDYTFQATFTFPNQPKTIWFAEKLFKKYQMLLNDRCFKKRAKGTVKMAVMVEGERRKNLHFHCALRCPSHMSYEKFAKRIVITWQDVVKNKSARVDIKKYTDAGWLDYTAKEVRFHNTDVFSVNNACNV